MNVLIDNLMRHYSQEEISDKIYELCGVRVEPEQITIIRDIEKELHKLYDAIEVHGDDVQR